MYKQLAIALAAAVALCSCNDGKSYAELLTDETKATNNFLANQNVILDVPADNNFEIDEDAPYYRLDEENNIYMQIISMGDLDDMAQDDELIYMRFTRYNLYSYDAATDDLGEGYGNATDLSLGSASFRYNNFTLTSSSMWGTGLQMPLKYIGINGEVNILIKSQYGLTDEIANVIPYLYNVRYFRAAT